MSEREEEGVRLCCWVSGDDDAGLWQSDCGHAFVFNDGGPMFNGFQHCPYCGRVLAEAKDEIATTPEPPAT
jgi:hypothetical protein